jgi:hypothetical protein
MTRRLLAEYRLPQYQIWRLIVSDIIPVNDFRENKRLRVGGYGDLPLVGEHDNYEEITSPEDEEVGYSVATRGGLEFLTRRMIINDDVGAIRRIPSIWPGPRPAPCSRPSSTSSSPTPPCLMTAWRCSTPAMPTWAAPP